MFPKWEEFNHWSPSYQPGPAAVHLEAISCTQSTVGPLNCLPAQSTSTATVRCETSRVRRQALLTFFLVQISKYQPSFLSPGISFIKLHIYHLRFQQLHTKTPDYFVREIWTWQSPWLTDCVFATLSASLPHPPTPSTFRVTIILTSFTSPPVYYFTEASLSSELVSGTDCDYETSDYEGDKPGYRWGDSSHEGDNEAENVGENENNNKLARQK